MMLIALAAVPNQEVSFQIDQTFYTLTVLETNGCMSVTVARDNTTLISAVRAMPDAPLLPYLYQEAGNFVFLTDDGALPYYDQFGTTQTPNYLTADELVTLRGA